MPDLSQRTLAHVMKVLESLTPEDADTYPMRREFWQQTLFRWGFPEWLIDEGTHQSFNWTAVIRNVYKGRFMKRSGSVLEIPSIIQESMLKRLTAMAITESEDTEEARQLRRSLQLDGFDVSDGKNVAMEGPISITEEKSRLLTNLAVSSFPRKDVIAKHLTDAEDLFSEGKMHPAMGQARSAFEAGVEDTVSLLEINTKRKAGGGLKNQIQFLSKEGFISVDEEQAFLSALETTIASLQSQLAAAPKSEQLNLLRDELARMQDERDILQCKNESLTASVQNLQPQADALARIKTEVQKGLNSMLNADERVLSLQAELDSLKAGERTIPVLERMKEILVQLKALFLAYQV